MSQTYPHYQTVDVPELGGRAYLFYRGWLSSMHSERAIIARHRFMPGNTSFRTPEHLFQAYKATKVEDFELIRRVPSPLGAKLRGKQIQLRADWEDAKFEIMFYAHLLKYRQQPALRANLLAIPHDVIIAEDAEFDDEWGCRDKQGGWTGGNKLGQVLRGVADELAVRVGA